MSKELQITPAQTERVKEVKALMTSIKENLEAISLKILAMLDQDGMSIEAISVETGLPENVVSNFERVGRKQLLPSLLFATFEAASYVKQLPYSKQVELLEQKGVVEVATVMPDGSIDFRKTTVDQITGGEIKQVFSRNGAGSNVRSLAQQRSYIESEKQKAAQSALKNAVPKDGWTVQGKHIIHKGEKLNKQTLLAMLAQID